MNDGELDAIEARAHAATPGPWEPTFEEHRLDSELVFFRHHIQVTDDALHDDAGEMIVADIDRSDRRTNFSPNAQFIAHARQDVPALVAEVRRLRAMLTRPPMR